MLRRCLLICLVSVLLCASVTEAAPKDVIRYHTEEWQGVTNRDGTGLYHDIMRAIFNARGMEVKTSYFPFRRAVMNIESGTADITGGTFKESTEYILSRYPVWVNKNSVLFHKDYLPGWRGLPTFEASLNEVISAPEVGDAFGIKSYEASSRALAIRMMLDGRKRYYLDDHAILKDLVNGGPGLAFEAGTTPARLGAVDWSEYALRNVRTRYWFMVFPNNERGRSVRDIFDEEFKKLHQSGELRRLYQKWNLEGVMIQDLDSLSPQ